MLSMSLRPFMEKAKALVLIARLINEAHVVYVIETFHGKG